MGTDGDFLLFEGSESSGRAFVLHMVFPRFVLEFGTDIPCELTLAEPAPAVDLSPLRSAAILFYQQELKSFEQYEIVRPEN